jgi:hypothetical protein
VKSFKRVANKPGAVNGGTDLSFQHERARPAVTDPSRWTFEYLVLLPLYQ